MNGCFQANILAVNAAGPRFVNLTRHWGPWPVVRVLPLSSADLSTRGLTPVQQVAVFRVWPELTGGEALASNQWLYPRDFQERGCTEMHFGEYELFPSLIGLSPLPPGRPRAFQRPPVRPSIPRYRDFSLPGGRSQRFRVQRRRLKRPLKARFHSGSRPSRGLTSPAAADS